MPEAATPPSSPLPPDISSETYEAFTQSPGQPKVRVEDVTLVYVTIMVHGVGMVEYDGTTEAVQTILKPP